MKRESVYRSHYGNLMYLTGELLVLFSVVLSMMKITDVIYSPLQHIPPTPLKIKL